MRFTWSVGEGKIFTTCAPHPLFLTLSLPLSLSLFLPAHYPRLSQVRPFFLGSPSWLPSQLVADAYLAVQWTLHTYVYTYNTSSRYICMSLGLSLCLSVYPTMCFYKEITFDDLLAISHVCSSLTRCCCCICCCDFCFSFCYYYCYC